MDELKKSGEDLEKIDLTEKIENDNINNQKQKKKKSKLTIFLVVIMSVLIAMFITFFIMGKVGYYLVRVSGTSMADTLKNDDVLVAKKGVDFKIGDIVIILLEGKEYSVIKRVIAMNEETVSIKSGKVYINGNLLDEPYAKGLIDEEDKTWKLQEGEIFYLGDNRANSNDSVDDGPCKKENVDAVVMNWSLDIRWFTNIVFWFSK